MSEVPVTAKDSQNPISVFSEAALIAWITLVGYLSTFLYSYAYLSFFNVPVYLIDLTLGKILSTVSLGLLVAFSLMAISDFIFSLDLVNRSAKARDITFFAIILAIGYGPSLFFSFDPYKVWLSVFFEVVVTSAIVALIFFAYYDYEKRRGRRKDPKWKQKQHRGPVGLMMRSFGPAPFLGVLFSILYLYNSFLFGLWSARNQATFMVIETPSPQVIVGSDGNNLISVSFDPGTHVITGQINLLSEGGVGAETVALVQTDTGPLRNPRLNILIFGF